MAEFRVKETGQGKRLLSRAAPHKKISSFSMANAQEWTELATEGIFDDVIEFVEPVALVDDGDAPLSSASKKRAAPDVAGDAPPAKKAKTASSVDPVATVEDIVPYAFDTTGEPLLSFAKQNIRAWAQVRTVTYKNGSQYRFRMGSFSKENSLRLAPWGNAALPP